jgi:hypothetical protein
MAAYIDLNAVRAGMVSDPKDYRWCGYGEAVAGRKRAREGLAAVFGEDSGWGKVSARYRLLVYAAGEAKGLTESGLPIQKGLTVEKVAQVVKERGKLPLHEVLRCRVRYFSDGVAIGSKEFVNEIFRLHRDNFGAKRKDGARPLRYAVWDGLCSARDLRKAAISFSTV